MRPSGDRWLAAPFAPSAAPSLSTVLALITLYSEEILDRESQDTLTQGSTFSDTEVKLSSNEGQYSIFIFQEGFKMKEEEEKRNQGALVNQLSALMGFNCQIDMKVKIENLYGNKIISIISR